jgi:hypothetical protein
MKPFVAVVALVLLSGCMRHPVAAQSTPAIDSPSAAAATPRPSPSPSPIVFMTPSPAPVGTPVARQVLAPARVVPAVALCATPIQRYQDGNAGPLFCRSGAIVVAAWRYFAPVDSRVMALGPAPSLDDVKSAISADFDRRSTNVNEYSGYQLARAYYGWNFAFDYWNFVLDGSYS